MKKPSVTKKQMETAHPYLPELYDRLRQGRVSRREFLRLATLLGMSAGAATIAAQCGVATPPPPSPTPKPTPTPQAEKIKRGGTLRVASQVRAVDHPARFEWIYDANQFRLIFEYLSQTDQNNMTHPYLLDRWEVTEDLQEWTLHLRQDVTWSNGDPFTADDVLFNFQQWLDPAVGSSILAAWEGFLTINGVEVVDDHTVKLHLDRPMVAVPENLFQYPAQIIHPSFDGDITSGQNPGTGPYQLAEFAVGSHVKIVRRQNYWQMGVDGQPLPYLDAIEWHDLGDNQLEWVSAIKSGQVHTMYNPNAQSFSALRDDPNIYVIPTPSSQARVLRFRVDMKPWNDNRFRKAVKLCQDRQKILDQAYYGQGLLGHDTHVSPVHPAFAPMDVPEFDPAQARVLLEEAGGREGRRLLFSIAVSADQPDTVAYAERLQKDADKAGIRITIDKMPEQEYANKWTEVPVGITAWTHRPLAIQVLPLAYIADSSGNPVPWNESRWVDEEFTTKLRQAQGILDVDERRKVMADLQRIQQERGSIGIAWWQNVWTVVNPGFQGFEAHPSSYNLWQRVWYDPDRDPFA